MRTSNNQLIDSVRALLRSIVLPELQSDLARARLRQILATLRDVDWDETPLTVLRENETLEALLENWGAEVQGRDDRVALHFDELARRNADLRRQLASRISEDDGNAWTQNHADTAEALANCAAARGSKRRAQSDKSLRDEHTKN